MARAIANQGQWSVVGVDDSVGDLGHCNCKKSEPVDQGPECINLETIVPGEDESNVFAGGSKFQVNKCLKSRKGHTECVENIQRLQEHCGDLPHRRK